MCRATIQLIMLLTRRLANFYFSSTIVKYESVSIRNNKLHFLNDIGINKVNMSLLSQKYIELGLVLLL